MTKVGWGLVVGLLLLGGPAVAHAQEELDPTVESLGWVALQWQDEGLHPEDPANWPRMVEIAQAYGFMEGVTPQQVALAIMAKAAAPRTGLVTVQFWMPSPYDAIGDWCRTADAKARALNRMFRAFTQMGAAFGVGMEIAGPTVALPVVGIPVNSLLLFGTSLMAGAATASMWLESDYRSQMARYNCASGKEEDSWIPRTLPRRVALVWRPRFPSL